MIEQSLYKNTKWIRITNPTVDELSEIRNEFDIDPSALNDLASPTPHQKVETYPNSLYAVFHFPAYRHSHKKSHIQEIDFVIGKDYVITVQYDTIDALLKLSGEEAVKDLLGEMSEEETDPGVIFVGVLKELYSAMEDELLNMGEKLKKVEDNVFLGQEKEMVGQISAISRDLLDLKRTLSPHNRNFENLLLVATKANDPKFASHVEKILDNIYIKLIEEVSDSIDLAKELRETNNSLLYTKQNETMKVLTIMAFVTFPLSLVASIFGMNTKILPIVGLPYDFWIILGFMFLSTLVMFIFFKTKKWL
ncbi:MAG: CorA family divalent cation transporter [Candidatus Pacebacteria bacterium]|nr:CorA family divalent cation transporter [Candidatus Paceibacterota bacterium]